MRSKLAAILIAAATLGGGIAAAAAVPASAPVAGVTWGITTSHAPAATPPGGRLWW